MSNESKLIGVNGEIFFIILGLNSIYFTFRLSVQCVGSPGDKQSRGHHKKNNLTNNQAVE